MTRTTSGAAVSESSAAALTLSAMYGTVTYSRITRWLDPRNRVSTRAAASATASTLRVHCGSVRASPSGMWFPDGSRSSTITRT